MGHFNAIGLQCNPRGPADDSAGSVWDTHEGVMLALEAAKVPDWLADELATELMDADCKLKPRLRAALQRIVDGADA